MHSLLLPIAWLLSVIVALFVGSFLKPYLSKKGENLATHEDIQKLVDQVAAVTQTTKEIEAKISDDVWARQKRWELKRDAVFKMLEIVGLLNWKLTTLAGVTTVTRPDAIKMLSVDQQQKGLQLRQEALFEINAALEEFNKTIGGILVVCGPTLRDHFVTLQGSVCGAATAMAMDGDETISKQKFEVAMNALDELMNLIRIDLGL